ncbi:MAG TPA: hypothetical protein VKB26_04765 [Candidatus Acidoferrales bacterium]|nr:hypothetical protein [Candidatus Acidoferrales bacterium]
MAFDRKDYGMKKNIPFIKTADRRITAKFPTLFPVARKILARESSRETGSSASQYQLVPNIFNETRSLFGDRSTRRCDDQLHAHSILPSTALVRVGQLLFFGENKSD